MFVRKLYYDTQTGAVVRSSMMRGHVRLTSLAEDMAVLPELAPYAATPDTLGVMVWTEPDQEVEDCMSRATGVSVDVSQTPHQIIYDYTPVDPPAPQMSDAEIILRALEGVPGEDEEGQV